MNDNMKVPEGWERVRLGEVAKIQGGFAFKSSEFIEDGIPIIKITNIVNNKVIITDNPNYISTNNLKLYSNYILRRGDVLIALSGATVGKVGRIIEIKNSLLNQRVGRFIVNNENLIQLYLYYLAIDEKLIKYILNNAPSSAQPNISPFFLEEFQILLPPLPEQQKIAEILETVDRAIEKTDKIIEKYKRIKQGLMQDLLTRGIDENGKIRSEKTHKFKNSPLGRIPEEWEVGNIKDLAELNPKTKIDPKKLYPFVEMDATPIMGKKYRYINFRKGREGGTKFKRGDILIARITPCAENGKSLLVPLDIQVGIGSTEFIVFRAKENIDNIFLFYLLISDHVRTVAIGLMEGTSGRQRIPNYVFEEVIKVAVPKFKFEQKRIAEILSQIDNTIEKEEAYKQKLERIKKGLMEDLLTGRVRVNKLIKEKEV